MNRLKIKSTYTGFLKVINTMTVYLLRVLIFDPNNVILTLLLNVDLISLIHSNDTYFTAPKVNTELNQTLI